MGLTLAEKIISKHAGKEVHAGELVIANVDVCAVQDGTGPLTVQEFKKLGKEKLNNPERTILFIDHASPSPRKELSNTHTVLRDFSKEYADRVFAHFVGEYSRGRTPNPDVLCNSEIKFGPFCEFAKKIGAEYVATGHYAGVERGSNGEIILVRADDENKDQTYFLNQLCSEQLSNVIFPLQHLAKPEVRRMAEEAGLITARKKDSTGICFIGERDFRKFLSQYLPMKKGEIRDLKGKVLGEHDGVFFYTIGQRKGFGLGGVSGEKNDAPYYVIDKDVKNNILYVNQGECDRLYSVALATENFNIISVGFADGDEVSVRTRHREALNPARIFKTDGGVRMEFLKPVRAVTPGQYAVVYKGKTCLGGGVICDKTPAIGFVPPAKR